MSFAFGPPGGHRPCFHGSLSSFCSPAISTDADSRIGFHCPASRDAALPFDRTHRPKPAPNALLAALRKQRMGQLPPTLISICLETGEDLLMQRSRIPAHL